jgi:hypothetical protein
MVLFDPHAPAHLRDLVNGRLHTERFIPDRIEARHREPQFANRLL